MLEKPNDSMQSANIIKTALSNIHLFAKRSERRHYENLLLEPSVHKNDVKDLSALQTSDHSDVAASVVTGSINSIEDLKTWYARRAAYTSSIGYPPYEKLLRVVLPQIWLHWHPFSKTPENLL